MTSQRYTVKLAILTGGRKVSKETGKAVVYIRVTTFQYGAKPKTKYNRTHISVKPKDFDKKEGKVKRSDPDARTKNYQIFLKRQAAEKEILASLFSIRNLIYPQTKGMHIYSF